MAVRCPLCLCPARSGFTTKTVPSKRRTAGRFSELRSDQPRRKGRNSSARRKARGR
ncbi:hypothetical protein VSDG_08826 [Cytospora chrysosperma]|uniref:Uncharacterized protein n=1 Tax=Cytospora chrysosperma TaxID=252740 RepID=A0A423VGR4_CYTCH|nr:hypothetical protein VSDG_08826 [Valsa sordida]